MRFDKIKKELLKPEYECEYPFFSSILTLNRHRRIQR
jgi:hypothetical protein